MDKQVGLSAFVDKKVRKENGKMDTDHDKNSQADALDSISDNFALPSLTFSPPFQQTECSVADSQRPQDNHASDLVDYNYASRSTASQEDPQQSPQDLQTILDLYKQMFSNKVLGLDDAQAVAAIIPLLTDVPEENRIERAVIVHVLGEKIRSEFYINDQPKPDLAETVKLVEKYEQSTKQLMPREFQSQTLRVERFVEHEIARGLAMAAAESTVERSPTASHELPSPSTPPSVKSSALSLDEILKAYKQKFPYKILGREDAEKVAEVYSYLKNSSEAGGLDDAIMFYTTGTEIRELYYLFHDLPEPNWPETIKKVKLYIQENDKTFGSLDVASFVRKEIRGEYRSNTQAPSNRHLKER